MWGSSRSCSIQIVVAAMAPAAEPISTGVDEGSAESGVEPIGMWERSVVAPSSDEYGPGRI